MAARSYVIPDIDDEDGDQKESPNLFSKRIKTDDPSATHQAESSVSDPTGENDFTASSIRPPPSIPSSSSLLVHSRQRGNPLLKYIRQVKWEYSDMILGGADYSMSRSSCALFLSLRYHQLNPNYIYERLKSNKLPYQLKILLAQCDVSDPSQSLKELARLCIIYDLTLLVSWNDEESARYLETYKIMEGKSADALMDLQQHQSTDFLTKYTEMMTQVKSINKTDGQTLLHAFGSLDRILNATNEELCVCPGLGTLKAQRLYQTFNQPFKRHHQQIQMQRQAKILDEKKYPDEQFSMPDIDEDMKIGDHILVDGKYPATILYIGPVENHFGDWVGIEWWNQQGKHNGTFQGKFYFKTKNPSNGLFIRQQRVQYGHTFSQAIHAQYIKSFSSDYIIKDINYSLFDQSLVRVVSKEDFFHGKMSYPNDVLFIIRKDYSDYAVELSSIIRIDLSSQWVNGFDENLEIYKNLSQIKELNIRQNLIENWSQLWIVLEKYFHQVEVLNVSNSRLNYDENPTKPFEGIQELVLIDTNNDCDSFENVLTFFPNLIHLYLDLNRLSFISEAFVHRIPNITNLSLSDNPTLKSWDPFVNQLGKLRHLEELILNNCGIDRIKINSQDNQTGLFPSLKYLYMSDNKISSFDSINELSLLPSLTGLSILRNPIYLLGQGDFETTKQEIIARSPNLTHLNRVLIYRDERRGAEIDYLQRYAQDYYEQKLDIVNEHKQYKRLVERYGEPLRPNTNKQPKKGLCIRSDLLKIMFEFGDENVTKIEKKIPSSMTVAKLKTFVRRLFPSQLTNDVQFNLFVVIDKQHKELISNDYQDIQFYLGHCVENDNNERPSFIRIETS